MSKKIAPLLTGDYQTLGGICNMIYSPVNINFMLKPEFTMLLVWGLYTVTSLILYYLGANMR